MTSQFKQAMITATTLLGLTIVVVACAALFAHVHFGSLSAANQYLRGDRLLVIDDSVKSLGKVSAGSKLKLRYNVANFTGRQIKIVGAQTSCTCSVVESETSIIDDGERKSITIDIAVPNTSKILEGTAEIFTDDPKYYVLRLGFTGEVIEPAPHDDYDRTHTH